MITDLGVLAAAPESGELTLVSVHPGIAVEAIKAETQWPLEISPDVTTTDPPSANELVALRSLTEPGTGGR